MEDQNFNFDIQYISTQCLKCFGAKIFRKNVRDCGHGTLFSENETLLLHLKKWKKLSLYTETSKSLSCYF